MIMFYVENIFLGTCYLKQKSLKILYQFDYLY